MPSAIRGLSAGVDNAGSSTADSAAASPCRGRARGSPARRRLTRPRCPVPAAHVGDCVESPVKWSELPSRIAQQHDFAFDDHKARGQDSKAAPSARTDTAVRLHSRTSDTHSQRFEWGHDELLTDVAEPVPRGARPGAGDQVVPRREQKVEGPSTVDGDVSG